MTSTEKLTAPRIRPNQPHDKEGPVFNEPWEAQAFAMALTLYEKGCFSWSEWAAYLGAEITQAKENGEVDDGQRYYYYWLAALEKIVADKNLLSPADLLERKQQWQTAVAHTHHGHPIQLDPF